jgi:hypothetical protein
LSYCRLHARQAYGLLSVESTGYEVVGCQQGVV